MLFGFGMAALVYRFQQNSGEQQLRFLYKYQEILVKARIRFVHSHDIRTGFEILRSFLRVYSFPGSLAHLESDYHTMIDDICEESFVIEYEQIRNSLKDTEDKDGMAERVNRFYLENKSAMQGLEIKEQLKGGKWMQDDMEKEKIMKYFINMHQKATDILLKRVSSAIVSYNAPLIYRFTEAVFGSMPQIMLQLFALISYDEWQRDIRWLPYLLVTMNFISNGRTNSTIFFRASFIQVLASFTFTVLDTIFRAGGILYICICTQFGFEGIGVLIAYLIGGSLYYSYIVRRMVYLKVGYTGGLLESVLISITSSLSGTTTFYVLTSGLSFAYDDTRVFFYGEIPLRCILTILSVVIGSLNSSEHHQFAYVILGSALTSFLLLRFILSYRTLYHAPSGNYIRLVLNHLTQNLCSPVCSYICFPRWLKSWVKNIRELESVELEAKYDNDETQTCFDKLAKAMLCDECIRKCSCFLSIWQVEYAVRFAIGAQTAFDHYSDLILAITWFKAGHIWWFSIWLVCVFFSTFVPGTLLVFSPNSDWCLVITMMLGFGMLNLLWKDATEYLEAFEDGIKFKSARSISIKLDEKLTKAHKKFQETDTAKQLLNFYDQKRKKIDKEREPQNTHTDHLVTWDLTFHHMDNEAAFEEVKEAIIRAVSHQSNVPEDEIKASFNRASSDGIITVKFAAHSENEAETIITDVSALTLEDMKADLATELSELTLSGEIPDLEAIGIPAEAEDDGLNAKDAGTQEEGCCACICLWYGNEDVQVAVKIDNDERREEKLEDLDGKIDIQKRTMRRKMDNFERCAAEALVWYAWVFNQCDYTGDSYKDLKSYNDEPKWFAKRNDTHKAALWLKKRSTKNSSKSSEIDFPLETYSAKDMMEYAALDPEKFNDEYMATLSDLRAEFIHKRNDYLTFKRRLTKALFVHNLPEIYKLWELMFEGIPQLILQVYVIFQDTTHGSDFFGIDAKTILIGSLSLSYFSAVISTVQLYYTWKCWIACFAFIYALLDIGSRGLSIAIPALAEVWWAVLIYSIYTLIVARVYYEILRLKTDFVKEWGSGIFPVLVVFLLGAVSIVCATPAIFFLTMVHADEEKALNIFAYAKYEATFRAMMGLVAFGALLMSHKAESHIGDGYTIWSLAAIFGGVLCASLFWIVEYFPAMKLIINKIPRDEQLLKREFQHNFAPSDSKDSRKDMIRAASIGERSRFDVGGEANSEAANNSEQ